MKPLIIQNKKKLGYAPNKPIITPKNEKSVTLYFSEINKLDAAIMNKNQEKEIFLKIIQGDEDAKKKIIYTNLKFVISIAKMYINQGLDFEDLINEGNIGLIKAVDKFDSDKDVKFISYAVWWIRQSILQALVEKGKIVRVPINKSESLNKVNRIIAQLEQTLERKPTLDEIVDHAQAINIKSNSTEIDTDDITNILLSKISPMSLDEPLFSRNGEDEGSLYDVLPSKGISNIPKSLQIEVEIAEILSTSNLSTQERNIIEMSYGVNTDKRYNLDEISDIYSISGERIRQIKLTAIRKLKYNPKIQILFDYSLDND